ncbi:phosphotransferase family protein [Streptomyces sp. NPDC058001]|uniref:phosphotransferase family protein n=1 Tax=Streptomyces sp. NPDC058001 TaxID=3346300 RepID=UPI0036DFD7BB
MSVPAPQSPAPVTSRLLGSVAEELAALAATVGDTGVAARLERATVLLDWVRGRLDADEETVAGMAREVTRLTHSVDEEGTAPLSAAVHRLLAADRTTRSGQSDATDQPPSDQPLTPAEVTGYLRTLRPGSGDEAHDVRAILGGYSKRTLLVSATIDGILQDIVLRQIPAGRRARALQPEFEVVKAVHGAGLPVPEPLWIEPDDNALGGAFFVTRRAPGRNVGDVWGAGTVSKDVCLEVASIYARLHRLDPAGITTPVSPRGTSAELHEMIDWQEATLAKRGIVVEPVLAALLSWLRAHVPEASPRRSLLHGDAAFSNLLIQDDQVTAVLDWEAAHIGNPAEELAYLRPSVEPVLPWEDFLDRYTASGGAAPAPPAMRFFEVWAHVWRHIGCLWLAQNYDVSGRYASAVAAYAHGPRFLSQAVTAAFGTP